MWVAHPATDEAFVLGEGPVWDAPRERLLWVDIRSGLVLVGRLVDGGIEVTDRLAFPGTVGAVTVSDDGSLLVAAQEHLVIVDPSGQRTDGPRILAEGTGRRLNDGKPDPAGRFLVGTLFMDEPGVESLVRLEADGTVTLLDPDLTLSNGLAWSPDGRLLYTVDTYRRTVWVRDYDVITGAVGVRREFIRLEDGYPDGMCADAEGHLWVAVFGGGQVRRFTPDGEWVGTVAVDAPHVTCPAFAGRDRTTLVITTATHELSDEQKAAFPDSGRVFLADVGIEGAPVGMWRPPYGTISGATPT
jgi:sugar lactone lactonase YvrE